MDHDIPHQELVKCVVVGDSSTGKTRLIVARATNQATPRSQLFQTHVPSVWAIDQYRCCQEVLENSWEVVDGVNITLRLWDTFGDHEKDRCFAYGRADVVLLCFSIADSLSLQNVKKVWMAEIKHFCPRTPIILCGTKNDLRTADLAALIKERGPVSHHCTKHRPFDPKGVIPPTEGRKVAKEINATYYETSSYTLYGVQEAFDNVVRAALIARRQHRFWQSNLKKVQKPLLQAPFLPSCPKEPHIHLQKSTYEENLASLLSDVTYADVTFVVQGELIQAEKVVLMAASSVFQDLFIVDLSSRSEVNHQKCTSRCGSSRSSDHHPTQDRNLLSPTAVGEGDNGVSSSTMQYHNKRLDLEDHYLSISPNGNTCFITSRQLPPGEQSTRPDSRTCIGSVHFGQYGKLNEANPDEVSEDELSVPVSIRCLPGHLLDHPAFYSIHLQQQEEVFSGRPVLRSVVVMDRKVTPDAFRTVLHYLYTGYVNRHSALDDVEMAASLLELTDLVRVIENIRQGEEYLNLDNSKLFLQHRKEKMRELFLEKSILSDITIKLDGGRVMAHKCLLMVRCDPMLAMLGGHFRESSYNEVELEGFREDIFCHLLEYLYTDECPSLNSWEDILSLIELANFLCLPQLVAICEDILVADLKRELDKTGEIDESVTSLLQSAKRHNAHQLYAWCIHYLSIHFINIEKNKPKVLCQICPEDIKLLESKRWPPRHYIDEADFYEKSLADLKKEYERGKKHKWCLK
ncbi:rho-related BTB domain-containing protein 1-like isoform X2 [Apostichopus japonicus]